MARADARYRITADDSQATRALKRVRRGFKDTARSVFAFRGQLLALAGVGGFAAVISSTLKSADRLNKLSDRLGVGTAALSEYAHVADLAGVSIQTLGTAWQRQTRRVAEAAKGTGEAKDALEELGVEVADLNLLSADRQFEILADAINDVENQADRVRIAMKLWDTEGVALLNITNQGTAAMRRQREEARQLGLSLDGLSADQASNAIDAMTRLTGTLEGLKQTAILAWAEDLATALDAIAQSIQGFAGGSQGSRISRAIADATAIGNFNILDPSTGGQAVQDYLARIGGQGVQLGPAFASGTVPAAPNPKLAALNERQLAVMENIERNTEISGSFSVFGN